MTGLDKLGIVTVVLAILLLIGSASATQITVSDVTITQGDTGTATVTLDQVPAHGLSGFKLFVTITDPSVADQMTYVVYNNKFNLFGTKATTPAWTDERTANPVNTVTYGGFQSGYVKAGDTTQGSFPGELSAGYPSDQQNVVLATLTFHGLSPGTTTIDATLDPLGLSGNLDQGGDNYVSATTVVDGIINVYGTPAAEFTFLPASPLAGETVTFTDASTGGITSWDMDFGDGSHSYVAGPWTHTYTTPDTYHATLTANNPLGPSSSVTHDIIVVSEPVPVADFTATPVIGIASITPAFTGTSTGGTPTSWTWAYRASGTSDPWTPFTSSGQTITDQTFMDGAYDIRLTATNSGGSNEVTKTQFLSVSAGPRRLTTLQTGTVSGDLYVGAFQTVPWGSQTSYATNTFEQTFNIPAFTNVQWARLYTVIYAAGTDNRAGTATVSFDADGDGTYETVLGTETLATAGTTAADVYPVNDHIDRQYSDYRLWYDVTSLITSGSPKAKVVATPVASNFDARIKTIDLVVAYNDGDTDTVQYWVNDGHDYQANAPTAGIDTTFDTDALTPSFVSATLQNIGLSSRDAAYNFTATAIENTPGTSNPSFETDVWDVKTLLMANLGSDSSLNYQTAGGSYKTTLATLKVRYVVPPVITSFTTSKNPASAGETVTFSAAASSAQPVTWDIDYGDGSAHGTANGLAASWTHSYADANTYTVTVVATNEGGSDTKTLIGGQVVVDKPIISFDPASQTFLPGESRVYTIVMDKAPQGLAGYDMVVSLASPAFADIVSVSYPSWARMTQSGTFPADSLRISGIDTAQQIIPGATGIVLANVTVRGTTAGTSQIALSSVIMDADGGAAIEPVLTEGTINVGSSAGPVADFSGDPVSGTGPLTVVLTDSSSGTIATRAWDFGDGNSTWISTATSFTHTYQTVGSYNVKLTVTGPGGSNTLLRNAYITVGDGSVPTVSIVAASYSGNYPKTVTFSANTTGNITGYQWSFGDGVSSTAPVTTITHTFTYPGDFGVTLKVTGPGGSTTSDPITIHVTNDAPVADFIATPYSGTAPLSVQFYDQSTHVVYGASGTAYLWQYSDDDGATWYDFPTGASDQNPSMTFATADIFTVRLTVTEGTEVSTHEETITTSGLAVDFSAPITSGVASAEHAFTTTFTATANPASSVTYTWDFGDGQTDTGATVTHTYYGHLTSFTVTVTADNGVDVASRTRTNYITTTPYLEAFSQYDNAGTITGSYAGLPQDLNGDYVYEDVNSNGRVDYDDVVAFYNAWYYHWFETNTDVDNILDYDYTGNGGLTTNDVVALYDRVYYG